MIKKEYERCLRCNRRLKNPEARKIGMGACCSKKSQKPTKQVSLIRLAEEFSNGKA